MQLKRTRAGFSLIELLIMVGIIAALSATTVPLYHSYQSKNDLYTSTSQMEQALNRAKLLAANGKNGSSWGVNTTNGVLFMGNSYATRNASYDELYDVPLSITAGGLTEIVFEKLTGKPSTTGSLLFTSDTGDEVELTINNFGVATMSGSLLAICYQATNTSIQDSLWPTYQAQGATVGTCGSSSSAGGGTSSSSSITYTCANTNGEIMPGMILLNGSSNGAFNMGGSDSILTTTGAIAVNSTHTNAARVSNSAHPVAMAMYIRGDIQESGSADFDSVTNMCINFSTSRADPLASLAAPDPGDEDDWEDEIDITSTTNMTISPGTYEGGFRVRGSARLTLNPGVYYLKDGGITIESSGQITGNGVFIYLDPSAGSDDIDIGGSAGVLTLTPMTSGTYAGISIFQERTSGNDIDLSNGAQVNLGGTLYAAGAKLQMDGSSVLHVHRFIGDEVEINTSAKLYLP